MDPKEAEDSGIETGAGKAVQMRKLFSSKYIFCGQQFKRKSTMTRHVDLVHPKTILQAWEARYNCDICSRSIQTTIFLR